MASLLNDGIRSSQYEIAEVENRRGSSRRVLSLCDQGGGQEFRLAVKIVCPRRLLGPRRIAAVCRVVL